MISLNCIVVDDDEKFVEGLEHQLKKLPFLQIIDRCRTYGETLLALQEHPKVDFILLDIFLESPDGLTGFDLLRHHQNLPPVIIISHAPENAIESYNIGKAVDFLVKPFNNDRLLIAINRTLGSNNQLYPEKKFLFFKMGRQFQKFYLDDIEYFEGYGTYTKVVMKDTTPIINESLSQLEKILNSRQFMRVHKSFLINLNKLEGYDTNNLFFKSNSIPIGLSYKSNIETVLKLFENDILGEE